MNYLGPIDGIGDNTALWSSAVSALRVPGSGDKVLQLGEGTYRFLDSCAPAMAPSYVPPAVLVRGMTKGATVTFNGQVL